MKTLLLATFGTLLLTSCGKDSGNAFVQTVTEENDQGCSVSKVELGTLIKCSDGTETLILDGKDGENGEDGKTPLMHTKTTIGKNECKKVLDGIWVESINNGEFFDVYSNDVCSDSLGEFCDNVEASYGSSGTFGSQKRGSGSVCWADDVQISGSLNKTTKELTIHAISYK
jgi:hypothetical protein